MHAARLLEFTNVPLLIHGPVPSSHNSAARCSRTGFFESLTGAQSGCARLALCGPLYKGRKYHLSILLHDATDEKNAVVNFVAIFFYPFESDGL
jgi:hypothetical protein